MSMQNMKRAGFAALLAGALLLVPADPIAAQTKLPGGVTSRLKKITGYLDKTVGRLKSGSTSRNDLDRAIEALTEIKKSYPDAAGHADVAAAEKRIAEVEASLGNAAGAKEQAKADQAATAAASEQVLVGWADKLAAFKTDACDMAKGGFGLPTEDVDQLLKHRARYEEAKAALAEFLATGLNKDDHHALRQAEYDIRTAIVNYEESRARIPATAVQKVDEALAWFAGRTGDALKTNLDKSQYERIATLVENSNRLFPGTPEVEALNAKKGELDRKMEEADQSILKNRRMLPDQFAGPEAEELKAMARTIVEKATPGAKILRIHLTSPQWQQEAATEWTDTTRTALQHRVTEYVNAQVAVEQGEGALCYTLHLNKDTVSGAKKPLTGHIMHKDRLLRENIP